VPESDKPEMLNGFHCVVCLGDPKKMPDCDECRGTGLLLRVPFAERPWDEVVDGLWLGGHDFQPSAENPAGDAVLTGTDFDLVVSLYKRHGEQWHPDPDRTIQMYHRMADSDLDPDHHSTIDVLASHVEDAVRHGDKVLVRCQAGLNRSSLVTGLALIKMGWSAENAINRMREVRSPYVLCNQSFVDYLMAVDGSSKDA
jgi:hypothetical protein